jgi:hypothetical protein
MRPELDPDPVMEDRADHVEEGTVREKTKRGHFSLIPYLLNQALDIRHYLKLIVLRIHDILGWIRIHASAILGIKVFLQFLHDDRRIQSRIRIRIRIHTFD